MHADVNGTAVMMDVEAGHYYGLNAVGTHIWDLLVEPRTAADIAADLPRRFEVEPAEAEEATLVFLADLLRRGLIEPAGA
jgi:hypothetical protein